MKRFMQFFAVLFVTFLSLFGSMEAHAIAAAQNAAVTTAFTDGSASVQLVVAGIITLAATLTGVALIYKWLSK